MTSSKTKEEEDYEKYLLDFKEETVNLNGCIIVIKPLTYRSFRWYSLMMKDAKKIDLARVEVKTEIDAKEATKEGV